MMFVIKCRDCGKMVDLDREGNRKEKYICCPHCGYASNLNPNHVENED